MRSLIRSLFATVSAAALAAALVFLLAPAARSESALAAAAAEPQLSADLAMVPADAAGFVHIRLAELWKNDMFAPLRQTWERAGDTVLRALDRQFAPAPSSIERATVFVQFHNKQPQVYGILAFSKPFDPDAVLKSFMPRAEKKMVSGKTVYEDPNGSIAIAFPDNRTILMAERHHHLEAYFEKAVPREGPLASSLQLAATRPLVAAANIKALPIPPEALQVVPNEFRPLLKAELVQVSLNLDAKAQLDARATYPDAAAAGDAETAMRALIARGRSELGKQRADMEGDFLGKKGPRPAEQLPEALATVYALGMMGRLDDMLANPKLVVRDGKNLVLNAEVPVQTIAAVGGYSAVSIGLLLPAVQKVRAAAANSASMNNLKQIGLAIHNYHDTYGHLPKDITDKNGKPLLSWRVAILPFIEQAPLYNQFKLDEPWDSEHNKKFSKMVVKVFSAPGAPNAPFAMDKDGYPLTNYLGISGPGAVFDGDKKIKLIDITDGTSNTVMVVETANGVAWAKPGDYPFDPKKPLPKIAAIDPNGFCNMLFADGSVQRINVKTAKEGYLKARFTRNGGEVIQK